MFSFAQRSYQKELLDGPDISFSAIKKNMEELNVINQKLGGHAVTLDGFRQLVQKNKKNDKLTVVEIGCGDGNNLRVLKNWAKKQALSVALKGVDNNPECINYAKGLAGNEGIEFLCVDYQNVQFTATPDIVFSSLFCHHFTDVEIIEMLQWMSANSRMGFFINDLHRHPLAYHAIKLLTHFFSKSYLVKNDAPLSVKRSFIRQDWIRLFDEAGISNFNCQWKWAFRWLIMTTNDAPNAI